MFVVGNGGEPRAVKLTRRNLAQWYTSSLLDHTIYIYEVKGQTYDKISAYLLWSDRVGGGHWRRGGGDPPPALGTCGGDDASAQVAHLADTETALLHFSNQLKGRLAKDMNHLYFTKFLKPGHIDLICSISHGWISMIMEFISDFNG